MNLVDDGGEASIDDARLEKEDSRAHEEQRPVGEGSAAVRGSPRGAGPTAINGNSAEDSAAARGSLRGAEPTTARQISVAAAAAGVGARGDTTAASEATFREDASRSVRVTRGAAAPVEVGPAMGRPDQPRGAGEWGHTPAVRWG